MTLTKRQKTAAFHAVLVSIVVCVIGALCFTVVNIMTQPAAAQPDIRTVNTQRYEQVHLGNNDGTVDHFCLGTTGIWYGPNNGDFAVEAGDPQCR